MKIGITCSSFDLFHAGHVKMLEEVGFENSRAKLIFPGMATIWQAEKPLD